MLREISADKLKRKTDEAQDFRLIEVLDPEKYNEWHLPGAENIRLDDLGPAAGIKFKQDEEIVVYCASFECKASTRASRKLDEMGYNILEYSGGKKSGKKKAIQ
jgi:rhodanese-related sulfurtransferase